MKFLIISLIMLSFSVSVFSQQTENDTLFLFNKNVVNNALKKTDSLQYAIFYFYRSYIAMLAAPLKKVPLYINDSLIFNLKANTAIILKVFKEGKLSISIHKKDDNEIAVKVKFGKQYFFKCEVTGGMLNSKTTIEAVPEKTGREETGIMKEEK